MTKYFKVNLRKNSINGPIVSNSEVITINTEATGSVTASDFLDNSMSGTVVTNTSRRGFFHKIITTVGAVYTVSTDKLTANEGETLTFTVNTTNVPIGTTLYWSFANVETIDFNVNTGSYVATTLSGQNPTSNIEASHFEGWINKIYLRNLGRYPENSTIVDFFVANLLTGNTNLSAIDSSVSSSTEALSYKIGGNAYPRSGSFQTTGSPYSITGTIIGDSKYEGTETADILIRTTSNSGPVVASNSVVFNDTSIIHGDFNPLISALIPGANFTMSFTTLSNVWAGSYFSINVLVPTGVGPVISSSNITIYNSEFVLPDQRSYTHTFTVKVNDGYTSANVSEYFRLGALLGGTGLFVGTGNILVIP